MKNGSGVFFTQEWKLERVKDAKAGWRGTVRCVGSRAAQLCVCRGLETQKQAARRYFFGKVSRPNLWPQSSVAKSDLTA